MTETQKRLYEIFQFKLDAWASKPRPHAKNWTGESIIANPEYFEKFSSFRTREWAEYVHAREQYFQSLTGKVH